MKHFFVTGTDTEIGKTTVSAGLVRALQRDGSKVAGMKPVAAGFVEVNGQWINEDVERLRRASNIPLSDPIYVTTSSDCAKNLVIVRFKKTR